MLWAQAGTAMAFGFRLGKHVGVLSRTKKTLDMIMLEMVS
jgi:hypothetical protein